MAYTPRQRVSGNGYYPASPRTATVSGLNTAREYEYARYTPRDAPTRSSTRDGASDYEPSPYETYPRNTPARNSGSFDVLCGDMILKHNGVNTQSATKEARNTQSGTCEGSHFARSQSRPSHAMIHTIMLLLLLEGNHNTSRKHGMQVSSLTLGALTLLVSLSPPTSPTASCPQEFLHFSPHPRPLCSSAALCFCGGGLVQSNL